MVQGKGDPCLPYTLKAEKSATPTLEDVRPVLAQRPRVQLLRERICRFMMLGVDRKQSELYEP